MTILTDDLLKLDDAAEVERIAAALRHALSQQIHRRGFVLGISGGVDSGVCAALCVRAVGPKKVFGLLLPERDSSSQSTERGAMVAKQLGIDFETFDIAPVLDAYGCYRWRDDAIRNLFPDYEATWKNKLVIGGGLQGSYNYFKIVVQTPAGEFKEARLGLKEYLQIVAATNFKQRTRKNVEYFHADRLNYAVVGTPNLLEYDQGFFVKNGDGAADVKPIAHLYKTQVYALARYLKLPVEVASAVPTTDTYSLAQGQDEFYFGLPWAQMDVALWAFNHQVSTAELARHLKITEESARAVYKDIEAKRRAAHYLHHAPISLA